MASVTAKITRLRWLLVDLGVSDPGPTPLLSDISSGECSLGGAHPSLSSSLSFSSPPLFCSSTSPLLHPPGAISIARDPVKHELTKHIGVDASYTRSQVQDRVITLQICS